MDLAGKADILVDIAQKNAAESLAAIQRKFPILHNIDQEHCNFILTIAGIFIASTRLKNLHIEHEEEKVLMEKIAENLNDREPERGIFGFEHCKSFFEKNFDALSKMGCDPRYIAADALGLWIVGR